MSTLKLIQNEIRRLEERAETSPTGLSLEDVRKLEILVKTGQSLITQPAIEPKDDNPASGLSDEELDEASKTE